MSSPDGNHPVYDSDGCEHRWWTRHVFSDGIVRFLTGERGHKRLVREEFPDGRAKHYNDDEPEGVWHSRWE